MISCYRDSSLQYVFREMSKMLASINIHACLLVYKQTVSVLREDAEQQKLVIVV